MSGLFNNNIPPGGGAPSNSQLGGINGGISSRGINSGGIISGDNHVVGNISGFVAFACSQPGIQYFTAPNGLTGQRQLVFRIGSAGDIGNISGALTSFDTPELTDIQLLNCAQSFFDKYMERFLPHRRLRIKYARESREVLKSMINAPPDARRNVEKCEAMGEKSIETLSKIEAIKAILADVHAWEIEEEDH